MIPHWRWRRWMAWQKRRHFEGELNSKYSFNGKWMEGKLSSRSLIRLEFIGRFLLFFRFLCIESPSVAFQHLLNSHYASQPTVQTTEIYFSGIRSRRKKEKKYLVSSAWTNFWCPSALQNLCVEWLTYSAAKKSQCEGGGTTYHYPQTDIQTRRRRKKIAKRRTEWPSL